MLDGEKADIESLRKAFSNGRTPDELDFLSLIKSCINRQDNGFELVEPLMANEKEAIQGMETKKLISPFTLARTLASLVYPELKKLQEKDKEHDDKDKDLQIQIDDALKNSTRALPVGSVILWGLTPDVLPANFVICDGRTVTINGNQYKVPNLVDRFALGIKSGNERNKEGGKTTVVLEEKHLPAHTHTTSGDSTDGYHEHLREECSIRGGFTKLASIPVTGDYVEYRVSSYNNSFGVIPDRYSVSINKGGHTHKIKETGGNVAHENMPPYCTVYYVIKIAN